MKIRPEQYPNYSYTSVNTNGKHNHNHVEKKSSSSSKKLCENYYGYYSSCSSSSSFLQYLFSNKSVLTRLLVSLVPPYGKLNIIYQDYEGSFLNVILLMIVIYNRIWTKDKIFLLIIPIVYVGFTTLLIRSISSLTKTRITLRELFCLISYGLFGHTLALLVSTFCQELFIPSLIIFGGLDSVRICCILLLRTRIPPYRFVICTPVTILHWLFLLYLELKTN